MRNCLSRVLPASVVASAILCVDLAAQTWSQLTPVPANPAPIARSYGSMAYDAAQGLTMLFGGYNGIAAPLGDFWSFDGQGWQQLGGTLPPARWGHGMVYDTRRAKLVLFGGFQPSPGNPIPDAIGLNDTWEYDGFGWTQIPTPTGPSRRGYFGMVYDPIRQRTVLFGGAGPNTTYLNDTWEWDGATWSQVAAAVRPPVRRGPAMAYDLEREEIVLFGGGALGTQFGDTWIFRNGAWTQRTPATSPPARWEATIAFDPHCGAATLHGGATFNYQTRFGDSWWWNGVSWQSLAGAMPTARHGAMAAMDLLGRRALWLGGRDSTGFRGDLWQCGFGCGRSMETVSAARAGQTAQYRYRYPSTANGNLYIELWTLHNPNRFLLPIPGFVPVGLTGVDVFFILAQPIGFLPVGGIQNTLSWTLPNTPSAVGFAFDVQTVDWDTRCDFLYWASNDIEETVAVGVPPSASFSATPTSGLAPLTVQFTDTSTNSPTSWQWDFQGDGIVDSTQQNPVFVYTSGGVYSARLTVGNVWGQASFQQTLNVAFPPPTASFTVTTVSGGVPLTVQFTDTSTFATSWQWDFENDGVIDSTQQNPSFTYTSAGTYSVRLVATGPGGSNTVTQNGLITAYDLPTFTATPSYGPSAPLTVQFAGAASFPVTQWLWDFQDDGTTDATGQNPSFTYTANGSYAVRLTVTSTVAPFTRTSARFAVQVGLPTPGPNPALNMVAIQPGTFQMGSTVVGGTSAPVHAVTITRPFWVGKYEVTQAQYQAVRGTNPSFYQGASYPNAAQRPVEQVSWNNAMAYCAALTAAEAAAGRIPAGYQYRLPTEAEWEYVCRAGTTTEWNTGASLVCGQANFGGCGPGQATTVVGSYPANPWGLFDTHGNVWEWCLDSWDRSSNYPSSAVSDPCVSSGPYRVVRGGSWGSGSNVCRSAVRDYYFPDDAYSYIGFRVCLAPVLVP